MKYDIIKKWGINTEIVPALNPTLKLYSLTHTTGTSFGGGVQHDSSQF